MPFVYGLKAYAMMVAAPQGFPDRTNRGQVRDQACRIRSGTQLGYGWRPLADITMQQLVDNHILGSG